MHQSLDMGNPKYIAKANVMFSTVEVLWLSPRIFQMSFSQTQIP